MAAVIFFDITSPIQPLTSEYLVCLGLWGRDLGLGLGVWLGSVLGLHFRVRIRMKE